MMTSIFWFVILMLAVFPVMCLSGYARRFQFQADRPQYMSMSVTSGGEKSPHGSASTATSDKIEMVQLPYALDGLAPVISKETMEYHYGKHYQNYVNTVNKLVAGTPFENVPLTQILRNAIPGALLNNAGQAYNHELYFLQFASRPESSAPEGALREAIDRSFGSFQEFQKQFNDSAVALFGSGWTWLYADVSGKVFIGNYPNGENPLMYGMVPLLGVDVWEHAYYIDYRNQRAEHLKSIWNIIDWETIERRYNDR